MIIFFFLEMGDSRVPVGEHFEGRGLDTPHVQGLSIQAGEKPGGVNADKPVSLCAAEGGRKERALVPPVFEGSKARLNRPVLH